MMKGRGLGGGKRTPGGFVEGGVWRVAHVWQRFVAFKRVLYHLLTRRDEDITMGEGAAHPVSRETISSQTER